MNNGAVDNFWLENLDISFIFRIFKGGWEAEYEGNDRVGENSGSEIDLFLSDYKEN